MLAKSELAKYPFTREAADFVKSTGIRVTDFTSEDNVLKRAKARIEQAILVGQVERHTEEHVVEILSFPIAVLIANQINDDYLKRRFALAEAKRAYADLKDESIENLLSIASEFGWKLRWNEEGSEEKLRIHFTDYLRNSVHFHHETWKLANSWLQDGFIRTNNKHLARLLQEEIRRHIEKKLEVIGDLEIPESIAETVKHLQNFYDRHKIIEEKISGLNDEAFPPCIISLLHGLRVGKNVPHMGRFTLTAFLLNVQMNPDEVVKLFNPVSDFSERVTRYQVEHIAGAKGGKTSYKPLNCTSMITHGLCVNRDTVCDTIRHPLSYYKKKVKLLKSNQGTGKWTASSSSVKNSGTTT